MAVTAAPMRILIGKVGLDGHDRGVKLDRACAARRRHGNHLYRTPSNAGAGGEHRHSGGRRRDRSEHPLRSAQYAVPSRVGVLKEQGAEDIVVFGGGIIPDEDIPALNAAGVKALFKPGAPMQEIVDS